ncbi:M55 family metallopeptidase [Abyssisolibacter fermentans]|nr:M55 family metallopeptidase [Abyssisolibacter fermentans]
MQDCIPPVKFNRSPPPYRDGRHLVPCYKEGFTMKVYVSVNIEGVTGRNT